MPWSHHWLVNDQEQPEHALTSLLMPNKEATVLSMAEIPEARSHRV